MSSRPPFTASNEEADVPVKAEVETQEDFGCWLNRWGDLFAHHAKAKASDQQLSSAWSNGYRQAIRDARDKHVPLTPNWMDAWHDWSDVPHD